MKTLIGVDIGTQGTKAALFAENGRCLATAFRPSRLHRPGPGTVEEDPERQVATVCEAVRRCIAEARINPADVAAMGICGQMAGLIGIGRDGRNVTPYDSWLDTRCTPYIGRMNKEAADEIIVKTGGPASFNHGPKILWWMHEHPRVFRSIHAFVQPGAYAAMRLCGLRGSDAFIDKTYLHFSGFADIRQNRWDASLCDRFSVPPDKLPRIVNPHDVVGALTPSMARRCGLCPGVPVVAGCGDTAASFLACGATREGICVDVAGTASVFAATTSVYIPDKQHKVLACGRAATPGLWHPYAYINGGGLNLDWFRTQIAVKKERPSLAIASLDRAAGRITAAHDLPFFIPHLGGRVSPSWPRLRGAWVGLTWSHTVAHLWRALLEGVALEYAVYRQVLARLNPSLPLSEVRVTGGGQKSALWNQLKAEALGVRVAQVNRVEGAPLGSALLAGFGVGLFGSLDEVARRWIGMGAVFRPHRSLASIYKARLERYQCLLAALNEWSETVSDTR